MTLEFILGTASASEDAFLIKRIDEWLKLDQKNEVVFLVPNHLKFETEVTVLQKLRNLNQMDDIAAIQLQVFSFSRLAWFYLQHSVFYDANSLSEAGSSMIIRKILLTEEENLLLFRGEIKKPGFIEQLVILMKELIQGNVDVQDVNDMIQQLNPTGDQDDLHLKLHDFNLIYEKYLNELLDKNIQTQHVIKLLSSFLRKKDLTNVMVVLNGYTYFSAEELELIEVFMQQANQVLCSLVLDRGYTNLPPERHELFYETGTLYYNVYQLARLNQIPILHDTRIPSRSEDTDQDLIELDNFWRESQKLAPLPIKPESLLVQNIQVWEAESMYGEIQHIAKEIRRLVALKKYRYQDIRIVTREMSPYSEILPPIFQMHDIPFYIDHETAMKQHPLVEFLHALFSIRQKYYRYTDIMRLLRTELFTPSKLSFESLKDWQEFQLEYRNKVDITENIALMYGYEGHVWIREKDWDYLNYEYQKESLDEDRNQILQGISNTIRQDIRRYLPPLFEKLDSISNGQQAATVFYQFLEEVGVERQLRFWRNQEIDKGNLAAARVHEQTWQALMNIMDEYVLIWGQDEFLWENFVEIFSTGLDNLSYSKVPTTIDQVRVSSYELVQRIKHKIVFVIGMTDQVIPAKIENQTLLTDEERQDIAQLLPFGKFILGDTTQRLAKEPFLAYLTFLTASQKLYLTTPVVRDDQKGMKVSPYLTRIANYFKIKIQKKLVAPPVLPPYNTQNFIGTYRTLISDLICLKRELKPENKELPFFWQTLEESLKSQSVSLQKLAKRVFASVTKRNIPQALQPELLKKLYGKTLYASVSKIESFYQCEYKYLLQYGLGLKEREVFGLSAATTGEFYHEALDQLFKVLITRNLSLIQLTSEELGAVTNEVLQNILGENRFAMLSSSNRMKYIRFQLTKTIQRVGWALQQQSERSGMTVQQTEVLFGHIGHQKGLESMKVPLTHGKQLELRGKIDRVDWLEVAGKPYLEIVDYKSSTHTFDFRDAYFGLAMQMVTYLDVALQNAVALIGKQAYPAGAFYLHVQNPVLKGEYQSDKMLQEFKYNGILLKDEALLTQLDHTIEPKQKSYVYPFNQTANEEFKSSQFVEPKEMTGLIEHNRKKLAEAGNKILQGSTALNPAYRDKQRIACSQCAFRSICQFDVLLEENQYRRIDRLTKKEVLDRLKEEGADNE